MSSIFNQAFDELSFALRADPDDDVTEDHDRLLVKGRVFAFLSGSSLVVDLPTDRRTDLSPAASSSRKTPNLPRTARGQPSTRPTTGSSSRPRLTSSLASLRSAATPKPRNPSHDYPSRQDPHDLTVQPRG